MPLVPQILTADAFQRFGQVNAYRPKGGQQNVEGAFKHSLAATVPILTLVTIENATNLPFLLRRLERHIHSSQTSLPLSAARSLVVVCESAANGRPMLGTVTAFMAAPEQVVTYGQTVWHHSITVLDAPSTFAMVMTQTGRDDDTEFYELDAPLEIVAPPMGPGG